MSIKTRNFKTFKKDWTTPGHPLCFAGLSTIVRYYNYKVPIPKIKQALSSIDAYTTYYESKKTSVSNPYYIYKKRQQFQMDLISIEDFWRNNKGSRYLLAVIDSYTKKAWVRPLVSKNAKVFLEAFNDIINSAVVPPTTLISDKGTEMKNKLFTGWCSSQNIKLIFTEDHASIIERFNKTIQNKIYKYIYAKGANYVENLQQLVQSYNESYHRSIKMSPNQAELPEYRDSLFINTRARYKKIEAKAKKQNNLQYKKGDTVRIKANKHKLGARSYDQSFLEEIFTINRVNKHLPVITYSLIDHEKKPIDGTFYYRELIKVIDTGVYKVEKILKRQTFNRKKWLYVKFKGWPTSFNGWIIEK